MDSLHGKVANWPTRNQDRLVANVIRAQLPSSMKAWLLTPRTDGVASPGLGKRPHPGSPLVISTLAILVLASIFDPAFAQSAAYQARCAVADTGAGRGKCPSNGFHDRLPVLTSLQPAVTPNVKAPARAWPMVLAVSGTRMAADRAAMLFPAVAAFSVSGAKARYAACARAYGVADATTSDDIASREDGRRPRRAVP